MPKSDEFGMVGSWIPVLNGVLYCPKSKANQVPDGCILGNCPHYLRWRPNAVEGGDEAILCDCEVPVDA